VVEFIHTHKTGALIEASVVSGAIVGGADISQLKAVTSFGRNIGLAFQISDDILDIEGDSKTMGKSVGADHRKRKITYPRVVGLDASKKVQSEKVETAIQSLTAFDHLAEPLRAIARYIIIREK
jgi:geranylgeranyl diphosphate synthase type II